MCIIDAIALLWLIDEDRDAASAGRRAVPELMRALGLAEKARRAHLVAMVHAPFSSGSYAAVFLSSLRLKTQD